MVSPGLPRLGGVVAALAFAALLASAQTPPPRIHEAIDPHSTFALPGSINPHVAGQAPSGRLDPSTPLNGITLDFQPTPQQKEALAALVQAQQTPGSSLYHAWITPAQYAALFGLSDADLTQIEAWLTSQGFNIDRVANSRNSITFSGTAAQVEAAFQTEMDRYHIDGRDHFANASALAIPSALAGIVAAVRNLNDFRPHPQVRFHTQTALTASPDFTSAQSGDHYLTPKDVATIYDINPAYNSGYNGGGQTIVVVGQSAISSSDITAFQSAAGFTAKAPTITLVPGTGTSVTSSGDEAESDLDVEYAGAMAYGATIDFIYVGSNQNYSVFDALQYAIDNDTGSVINISYGACEASMSSSSFTALENVMEQAASQGQSIIAASGDTGSTGCYGTPGMSLTQQEVLSVSYPASSAYATGVGGTEFPSADVAASNSTYWESASGGSDVISSARSYIPEGVWNDDSAAVGTQYGAQYALSSSGGGVSTFAARPSWQTGVAGIPSGNFRLVPDVSLDASAENAGYLFCTSDTSAWNSGQKASCDSGFRDSATQDLTVAGGTSFSSPIFAAMVAMIDQKQNASQGVAASVLYKLAANGSTYASAFHDITSGTNDCASAGANYCSGSGLTDYPATTGYDEATGLGSVDFNNLLGAWSSGSSGSSSSGSGTGTFALSASSLTVKAGASGVSTVSILSQNSYAGTVGFALTGSGASLLSSGCYTISNTPVTAGATATTTLTIYTAASTCSSTSGARSFARVAAGTTASSRPPSSPFRRSVPFTAAVAGFLFLGIRKFRSRAGALLGCLLLVGVLGFATGCGNSSGTNPSNSTTTTTTPANVATGTYTLTLTGTDTSNSAITASTQLTLTVN